jgi:hypothetical protein
MVRGLARTKKQWSNKLLLAHGKEIGDCLVVDKETIVMKDKKRLKLERATQTFSLARACFLPLIDL